MELSVAVFGRPARSPSVQCPRGDRRAHALARAGGCAAKYSAARLETLLAGLVRPKPRISSSASIRPTMRRSTASTTSARSSSRSTSSRPLVDDPRTFGAIAATNALNDVFAMGGAPLLALSVAAFPEELPVEVLGEVLAGADERVRAAGAILAGGHTIRDAEPKYGLAVVGTVHPERIWPKVGRAPGRRALPDEAASAPGSCCRRSGTESRPRRARRGDRVDARAEPRSGGRHPAVRAERGDRRDGVRAARAARELASRSGVRVVSTPRRCRRSRRARARRGRCADRRRPAEPRVRGAARREQRRAAAEALAYDPQTAGGLLVSMPGERAAVLEATLAAAGLARSADRPRRGRLGSRLPLVAVAVASRRTVSARHVPPDRARVVRRALPRHHVGRVRAADRLRARLRELAELRRQAVSRAGLPRLRRVRKPDGRARRDRAHARRLARVAVDERPLAAGGGGARSARSSSPSRRFRWAASRSRSISIRSP